MKHSFLILFAVLSLQACHEHATTTHTTGTAVLEETDLFNSSRVADYLQTNPAQETKANDYFLAGIDAYRNKKDIAGAIGSFRKSILMRPSAKAYYELGNASLDAKDYQSAIAAYRVGEQLGFQPLSKLLYNTACAYSGAKKKDSALAFLEYAIEAGYSNGDQILSDPDLLLARTAENFQSVYQAAMGGSSDPAAVAWLSFKRGFAAASFPLVLNQETTVNEQQSIAYDFEKFVPEMKGERFSREVGKEFFFVAKVADQPNYTSLVYAVKNSMMGEAAPTAFMLASFSAKGALVDKMIAGGQLAPGELYKVGTLQQSGQFEVKDYEQVYQQDPAEHGYEGNKLMSSDLKNTRHYRISADGHFVTDEQMIGLR